MKEFEDIDVELLISLVHDRPVNRDESLEYKSRAGTTAAWREVRSHVTLECFFFFFFS